MAINQRQVYLLPHPLGNGEPHYHIVLSIREANDHEQTFLAAMITTSPVYYDDFSFDLSDEMFDKPLPKAGSHVRMHLIMLERNEDICKHPSIATMKVEYFNQLMRSIGEAIFNFKFLPI